MFRTVCVIEELHSHQLCKHKSTGQSHSVQFHSVLVSCKHRDDTEGLNNVLKEYFEIK